jgi:hypothetical protein
MNDDPFRDKVPEWVKEMQGRVDDAEARAIEATLGAAAQIQTLTAQRNRAQAMADHRKLETAITKARLKAAVEKEVAELKLRADRAEAKQCVSCGQGMCPHPARERRRLRLFPVPLWTCDRCGQRKEGFGAWQDAPDDDEWGFDGEEDYASPRHRINADQRNEVIPDAYPYAPTPVTPKDEPAKTEGCDLHVWEHDGDYYVATDRDHLASLLEDGTANARVEQWTRVEDWVKLTMRRNGADVILTCGEWAAVTRPGLLAEED